MKGLVGSSATLALTKTSLPEPQADSSEPQRAQLQKGGASSTAPSRSSPKDLLSYFHSIAPSLLRPAEGVLKYPSVAPSLPGKEYSTSLWDWDTYWTARGLFRVAALTNDSALRTALIEHTRGSLLNFFSAQSAEGRIPILMTIHQVDPFGCLGREGAHTKNQAKPIMAQMALLIADETNDVTWLAPHFDRLKRFHDSWLHSNFSACGLLVWSDDVAIGNDNDPATFGRPAFSSANLLLNCLYYEDLMAAKELAVRLKRNEQAQEWEEQAEKIAASIRKQCWDPRDSYFYSVDVQCVDRRKELITDIPGGMAMSWQSLPVRIKMFTGFLPLWAGVAEKEEAAAMIEGSYRNSDELRAFSGVRTLSKRETMYSLEKSSNPSNWLGPVWIIANYFAWKGFVRYGFKAEADHLAKKTLSILEADLRRNGSLNEYYHPDTGLALSHQGFVDWNLLALEMLPQA